MLAFEAELAIYRYHLDQLKVRTGYALGPRRSPRCRTEWLQGQGGLTG
jgi:hypothetical protein